MAVRCRVMLIYVLFKLLKSSLVLFFIIALTCVFGYTFRKNYFSSVIVTRLIFTDVHNAPFNRRQHKLITERRVSYLRVFIIPEDNRVVIKQKFLIYDSK